jgi:mRNA-degrading endonuclease RelE of RelBE toxin-antitoxin system
MAWRAVFAPGAAKTTRNLPPDVKRSVGSALRALLADPYAGKALLRELDGLYSYRVRRYRIVYELATTRRELRIIARGLRHLHQNFEDRRRRRLWQRALGAVHGGSDLIH